MGYTLGNLLRDIYTELGQLFVSTADSGSLTTAVDAGQSGMHRDDDWRDGTLLVIEAGGTAPEGEFQRISAYEDLTGTFTVDSAFGSAIEAGDTFGFTSGQFPLKTMIELANAGLRSLGDIALADNTTLITSSGRREYPASLEWKRRRPLMIDVQEKAGTPGDEAWNRIYDWEYEPAAAGIEGRIVFGEQLPAGRNLRIWYIDQHPRVQMHGDEVCETIVPELAAAAGVERALGWQHARLGGGDIYIGRLWREARASLAEARVRFPMWSPRRVAQLMAVRGGR